MPVNCSDMKSLRGLLSTEKLVKPSQLSNPPRAAKAWGSERGREPGRLDRPPGPPDTSGPCLPGLPLGCAPTSLCLPWGPPSLPRQPDHAPSHPLRPPPHGNEGARPGFPLSGSSLTEPLPAGSRLPVERPKQSSLSVTSPFQSPSLNPSL